MKKNRCVIAAVLVASLIMLLALLTGCTKKEKTLKIPNEYRTSIRVNYFEDTWSVKEDGSDWLGSFSYASGEDEYKFISQYLDDRKLLEVFNSGNFMPDFSFVSGDSGKNGYDFVFIGDSELVLRDPDGNCSKVDISGDDYFTLKEYIGELRLGYALQTPGAYSQDRELTDEDRAIFEEAMKGIVGVSYEPTLVATQVVAGINYRFTTTATIVVPDAESTTKYVYIFKPLGDEAPVVTDILDEKTE